MTLNSLREGHFVLRFISSVNLIEQNVVVYTLNKERRKQHHKHELAAIQR